MTFFFLLALIVYIRSNAENYWSKIRLWLLTPLLYLLSLLSKEMAITFPAVVILYDFVPRNVYQKVGDVKNLINRLKSRIQIYAGLMLISLIYLTLRFVVLYNPREALKASAGNLVDRIIFLPGHLAKFLGLTIYPANLNADYVYTYPSRFFDTGNFIGAAVVIALVVGAFYVHRFSKVISFSIWWYLMTLFPVYNLIEIYHPLAERYLYLPIIGFCLAVPVIINAVARWRFTNPTTITWATLLPIVVIVGLYSGATIQRNRVWQSNFSLWSNTIQVSPDSLVARGGLGMAYLEKGMLDEAARQFEEAIKRYPKHHKSYYNLGVVYHRRGDLKKALEYFNRSIELNPDSVRAHYNLATIYLQQQRWELAIRHYVKVNELDPEIATAHFNLGMAYANQGNLKSAVSEWEKVLELDPRHTMARNNILKARKMMNRGME